MATTKNTNSQLALKPSEAKVILSKIIDAQVSTYRLEAHSEWERNHKNSSKWNEEIERLLELKRSLHEEIGQIEDEEKTLNINISIQVSESQNQRLSSVNY